MGHVWGSFIDLLKLGRFQFLFGGLLLYILGIGVAVEMGFPINTMRAVLGYFVLTPAHLSVSYSNDLYDMKADRFNPGTLFTGGSGVLKRRPDLKRWAHFISVSLISISILGSILFTIHYSISPLFIVFVLFGSLLGWFYTAPPLKLSYRGLGEISTAATVGILVPLFGFYTVAGSLPVEILFFLFPMGLSGIVFVLIVQIPDMEADHKGGKRTWVGKIGRRRSFIFLFTAVFFQSLYYGIFAFIGFEPGGVSICPIFLISLTLLFASLPCLIMRPEDRETATRMAMLNMIALFLFVGLVNMVFFIYL